MISFNNWISCVIWERNTFNYFLMVHKIWIEYPQVSYPRIYFLLILCDSLQEESFIYKVESLEPFQNGSCPHRWNCLRQGGARIFCKQKSGCSSEFFSFFFFFYLFFASGGGLSLCPEILQYAQWLCLSSEFSTVRDAGFEPGTTASVVWSATNEPPHLQMNFYSFGLEVVVFLFATFFLGFQDQCCGAEAI